jgi:ubiquinone/menaquinone biosynthesis C-methylase UbiE
MPLFTPPRVDEPELLDEHDAPRADMERSLRDLRRFNRYFGGTGVYRRLLRRMAPDRSERLVIIDLGAGTADLLDSLPDYYRNLLAVGMDLNIGHLLYLRDGSRARRVVGDATRLPFRDGAADVVTSAHFFHHFAPEENAAILGEALRVARRGAIVNDTRRHYVPLAVVKAMAALRVVGRITRNDAPASIRRGYSMAEAREIGARVRARRLEAVRAWPFRFGLLLWR